MVCRTAFVRLPDQPPLDIQEGREDEAADLLTEARAQMTGDADAEADPSSTPSLASPSGSGSATDEAEEAVTSDMDVDEAAPAPSPPTKTPRAKKAAKVVDSSSPRRSPRNARAVVA